ncbi:lactosylceramide 1,3-N-acetyl-beta-D-glucosaminyltransferase-like [Pecten maximus]|uniref:lactosylceramide 1,3-N-acetyl-beta-D-glucosaminyltransferase-like n=1 Tax=Pecten maximus TaxID=6579 RepID=UPI0014589D50|nr:lactosylceramide 1,3-N-acetyl-beta-D-glucosaminyltransferase-like [Pecten maximus]
MGVHWKTRIKRLLSPNDRRHTWFSSKLLHSRRTCVVTMVIIVYVLYLRSEHPKPYMPDIQFREKDNTGLKSPGFYIRSIYEQIYYIFVNFREVENQNIESLMRSPKKSFFGIHLDVRDIVDMKIKNSASELKTTGLVNLHPFRYLNNPGHCQFKNNGMRTILIIVKSTVRNVLLRHAIRKTWGNIIDENVKIVFMLGRNNSRHFQQDTIDTEAAKYKDIVQEDFVDTYFNNTLKSIMSFNWAAQYCEDAQFLLFVDDDFLIDVPKIQNYIYSIPESDVATLFTGHRIIQPVVRDRESKWYLSWEAFPYKYWPPYLAGGAYLTSMPVAKKFSYAFPYIDMLGIDDAWLGIVARNLRIYPQDHHFFHNNGRYSHLALVYQCCHTEKKMLETWWQYKHSASFRFGTL